MVKDIFVLNILKMYHKYRKFLIPSNTTNMLSAAIFASTYNLHINQKSG